TGQRPAGPQISAIRSAEAAPVGEEHLAVLLDPRVATHPGVDVHQPTVGESHYVLHRQGQSPADAGHSAGRGAPTGQRGCDPQRSWSPRSCSKGVRESSEMRSTLPTSSTAGAVNPGTAPEVATNSAPNSAAARATRRSRPSSVVPCAPPKSSVAAKTPVGTTTARR